jgi:hypothetical protein
MKVFEALGPMLGLLIVTALAAQEQFNAPPNVDVWCGKAYKAG